MTEDQIRRILWRCIWMSRGSAPVEADYAYWVPMWPGLIARGIEINHPNYGEDRVLGWQAEGADAARYGDYATPPTAYHTVPPYPGDTADPPIPDAGPSPEMVMLSLVLKRCDELEALIQAWHVAFPGYDGTVQVPYLGTGKISLTPKA